MNEDKAVLGIEISDEEITNLSKNKFQKYIENKIEKYALLQLNVLKAKHQKSQYLDSNSFKTAQYLIDDRFSKPEANLLFKLRSKTLNLRMNYENQHSNTLCQICGLFPESQAHLLQCPQIAPKLKLVSKEVMDESFIYGNADRQLTIVKIYMQVMEIRGKILEERSEMQSCQSRLADACGASLMCSNCSNVNCNCNGC